MLGPELCVFHWVWAHRSPVFRPWPNGKSSHEFIGYSSGIHHWQYFSGLTPSACWYLAISLAVTRRCHQVAFMVCATGLSPCHHNPGLRLSLSLKCVLHFCNNAPLVGQCVIQVLVWSMHRINDMARTSVAYLCIVVHPDGCHTRLRPLCRRGDRPLNTHQQHIGMRAGALWLLGYVLC